MKRFFLAVMLMLLVPAYLWEDVLPGDHHLVDRQIRITNISEYPQIGLIGYITGKLCLGSRNNDLFFSS